MIETKIICCPKVVGPAFVGLGRIEDGSYFLSMFVLLNRQSQSGVLQKETEGSNC